MGTYMHSEIVNFLSFRNYQELICNYYIIEGFIAYERDNITVIRWIVTGNYGERIGQKLCEIEKLIKDNYNLDCWMDGEIHDCLFIDREDKNYGKE